jgi:hypothetical protein
MRFIVSCLSEGIAIRFIGGCLKDFRSVKMKQLDENKEIWDRKAH